MGSHRESSKRERFSSEGAIKEREAKRPKMTVYQQLLQGGNNYKNRNPFQPPVPHYDMPDSIGAIPSPQTTKETRPEPGQFICEYCKMAFENKDKLWSHTLRVPHGINDEGEAVVVPAGYGLIENARIAPVTEGYYLDEYCRITKKPTPPARRVSSKPGAPAVVNPPPFFEPGCPDTGVFLPVGTKGTSNYPKALTWHCPWEGCDKKNWKVWRVNRHINNIHVQVKRSYAICSCGQAFGTKAEEEAHRDLVGHDKAL